MDILLNVYRVSIRLNFRGGFFMHAQVNYAYSTIYRHLPALREIPATCSILCLIFICPRLLSPLYTVYSPLGRLSSQKVKTHRRQCKMTSSNNLTWKWTLRPDVYLSADQNPIPPPPSHTVHVYTVYLFTQGREGRGEGGELNQRERQRGQQFTKLGLKYQHD